MKANVLILTVALLAAACHSWHSDPQVTFYNNNVLLPSIEFKTPDSSSVYIEYWPAHKPRLKQRTKSSTGLHHAITLFNLKPNTRYAFRLLSGNSRLQSKEFSFVTDSVPGDILRIRKDKIDTTLFNGYILLRRFFKQGADVLIDREGNIVWYHVYDTAIRRAFSWTKNNTILSIYDSARIMETDLLGNVLLDLDLERLGLPYKVHHEVFYDPAGNIVTITHDSAKYDLRRFGGKEDQYLTADGILVLSKKGEVLWKWNLLQALNPEKFNGKINLQGNWGHANSIALDGQGNYLISFRDFNQVWKIDGKSGTVMWKFGENGTIKPDTPSDYFIGQHSVHLNAKGDVMMFDNGNFAIRPNSRVLSFTIDEAARTAKSVIRVELPRELSSYRMSSAEMISEGKYLVCTTRKNAAVTLVNDTGEILWKIFADHASYRACYISNPFEDVNETREGSF